MQDLLEELDREVELLKTLCIDDDGNLKVQGGCQDYDANGSWRLRKNVKADKIEISNLNLTLQSERRARDDVEKKLSAQKAEICELNKYVRLGNLMRILLNSSDN